jgi:hypothetical protein
MVVLGSTPGSAAAAALIRKFLEIAASLAAQMVPNGLAGEPSSSPLVLAPSTMNVRAGLSRQLVGRDGDEL